MTKLYFGDKYHDYKPYRHEKKDLDERIESYSGLEYEIASRLGLLSKTYLIRHAQQHRCHSGSSCPVNIQPSDGFPKQSAAHTLLAYCGAIGCETDRYKVEAVGLCPTLATNIFWANKLIESSADFAGSLGLYREYVMTFSSWQSEVRAGSPMSGICDLDVVRKHVHESDREKRIVCQRGGMNGQPIPPMCLQLMWMYLEMLEDHIAAKDDEEGRHGFVYVLSNESLEYLKIGYTERDAQTRARELSKQTSMPTEFVVEHSHQCDEPHRVEQKAHKDLSEYRVNDSREFFNLDIDDAVSAIEQADREVNGE